MDSDKSMYAIERVDKDTYALCKLAHWVSAKDLRGDSAGKIVGRVPLLPISHNTCAKGKNVESNAKEKALDKPVIEAPNRNVPTDGAKSDGKHSTTTSHPLRHSEQLVSQVNDVETGLDPRSPELPEELPERLLTARQIFERLLCQYMETLYLSKASLTFFTKGPLSKARVAFTSSNQPLDMSELAEFLRSLCLTSSAMEKKYREKLVGIVKDAPILAISDEDVPANSPLRRKPAKRLHPTKAGMFPFEEDFVKRWWSSDDSSPSRRRADETAETMMRRRLASLRLRETLIQVILLLETLAFETSPAFMAKKANENAQSLKETGSEGTEPKPDKKPKSSAKAQDLTLALDIVVDKLCIWQSVEQDTHTSLITPQKDDKREASRSTPLRGTGSDLLRDFYSEVILPLLVAFSRSFLVLIES